MSDMKNLGEKNIYSTKCPMCFGEKKIKVIFCKEPKNKLQEMMNILMDCDMCEGKGNVNIIF